MALPSCLYRISVTDKPQEEGRRNRLVSGPHVETEGGHEVTGKQRGRLFVYRQYLDILNEGMEPLPGRRTVI